MYLMRANIYISDSQYLLYKLSRNLEACDVGCIEKVSLGLSGVVNVNGELTTVDVHQRGLLQSKQNTV